MAKQHVDELDENGLVEVGDDVTRQRAEDDHPCSLYIYHQLC